MPFIPQYEGEFPSLGYEVVDWIENFLQKPDSPDVEPFRLYQEQVEFIINMYRLDPATGRRVFHRAVLSRPRGWGKSPLAAALCAVEALGPVLFDGWDASGQPVGKPWSSIRTPLVNIAAVSEEQTANTYRSLLEMLESDAIYDEYPGIEPLGGFVNLPRGRIAPIAASGSSIKGARAVFAVMDQALALDTPIPTPSGWKTMGELVDGDVIYGSSGPVVVSEAKPVSVEHDCYRVTFSDGTSVVASAGHLWLSRRVSWPKCYEKVRTTEEMRDGYRYSIPAARVMDSPEVALPADPYLLGYWLGDGTRGKCELAVGARDLEAVTEVLGNRGIFVKPRRYMAKDGHAAAFNVSFSRKAGFQGVDRPIHARQISGLPCYLDKHVPEVFFTGSAQQRLDLLRGLMDSDGSVTTSGLCTFVNTNRNLADSVVRLLRSLGQITSGVKVFEDARYSNGCRYRVDFTPRLGVVPFNLPRKAERVRMQKADNISIVSIEPVDRVPVRCIAVDSEDHLFAFGEAGHLTHNTEVWYKSNGGHRLAGVMRSNAAKLGGCTLETPNAFIPGEESVAEMSANYAQQIAEGTAVHEGLFWSHREAPASTDLTDKNSLIEGLRYAYGDAAGHSGGCSLHLPSCPPGHVDLERLVAEIWDPSKDVQESRADFLNQITHASDSWMSKPDLMRQALPDLVVPEGETVVLGFDGSRGRAKGKADATALVGMTVPGKHLFSIGVWEKRQHDPQDWAPDVAEVDAVIRETMEKYHVVGFYADPSGWVGQVADWEARYGRKLAVKATRDAPLSAWPRGKNTRAAAAVDALRQGLVQGEVTWDGSSVMQRHFLNARRRSVRGGGYLLYKAFPDSPDKIDAAYAAVMAYSACLDAISMGVGGKRRGRARTVFMR